MPSTLTPTVKRHEQRCHELDNEKACLFVVSQTNDPTRFYSSRFRAHLFPRLHSDLDEAVRSDYESKLEDAMKYAEDAISSWTYPKSSFLPRLSKKLFSEKDDIEKEYATDVQTRMAEWVLATQGIHNDAGRWGGISVRVMNEKQWSSMLKRCGHGPLETEDTATTSTIEE